MTAAARIPSKATYDIRRADARTTTSHGRRNAHGRQTYEFFAAAFPHQTGEYGAKINSIRKYVFSNTLNEASWGNSS